MDTFHSEIYKITDFLFLCGERLIETESFILELTRRRNRTPAENWRKKIEEFLEESRERNCNVDVFDKRTNLTSSLNNVNPLKLRTLYMEIIAHLDLHEQFSVVQTEDPLIFSFSAYDEKQDLEHVNSLN